MANSTAGATKQCLGRLMDSDSDKFGISTRTLNSNIRFPYNQRYNQVCIMSMNGCQGEGQEKKKSPLLGTIETRTFPIVPSHALALERLCSAISQLKTNPPLFTSGIIRLQVPIEQQMEGIEWLHAQDQLLPRCFFSGRTQIQKNSSLFLDIGNGNGNGNGSGNWNENGNGNGIGNWNGYMNWAYGNPVSVAGVGSAVFFRHLHPFSYSDWTSIKRRSSFLPYDLAPKY